MEIDVPVAIVGGGPCGLMTALLLARSGVESTVFERKPSTSVHPKAMGLSRRTAEILRQHGLIERIMGGSLPIEGRCLGIWAKSLVGEEYGRVPLAALHSEFTPCKTLHCPQTWTEKVLREALEQETVADLRFNSEVVSIEHREDDVRLQLSTGESVRAQWVVAADGAGSGIRRDLSIDTDGPGDMGHFINVMFQARYGRHLGDRLAVLYQALSEEYFETFVAVNGDNLWLMHHFLKPNETPEDYTKGRFEGIIRHVSGLPDEPVEVISMRHWVMSPKVAMRFRIGRVFLVGDAAARLSPAGGLGLNTGLQSSHNLAWKLAAVVRGDASDSLLDSYEAERHTAALKTMENTNDNALEVFEIIQAGLRGETDRVRELVAHSRRAGAGLGQDLGVVYESGAFISDGTKPPKVADPINDYIPSACPGCRAPHVWIERNEGRRSILDLFEGTMVLLAGRKGDMWHEPPFGSFMRNHVDFVCEEFEGLYGIGESGAVLVRPDGYVGARFKSAPEDPEGALHEALYGILAK
ncbi:MAG TPA: FAD-dependent monooxygenase [Terrimicrobiaceae bacterium]